MAGSERSIAVRVLDGVHADAQLVLHSARLTVGCGETSDVFLCDQGVIDRHLCIEWRAGSWWVQPLNAQAPVLFGGRTLPMTATRLGGRVELDIGAARIELVPSGAAPPVRPRASGAPPKRRLWPWLTVASAAGLATLALAGLGEATQRGAPAASSAVPPPMPSSDPTPSEGESPEDALLAPWPHVRWVGHGHGGRLQGTVQTEAEKASLLALPRWRGVTPLQVAVVSRENVQQLLDQFVDEPDLRVRLGDDGVLEVNGDARNASTRQRLTKLEKDLAVSTRLRINVTYRGVEADERQRVWHTTAAKAGWRFKQVNTSSSVAFLELEDGARYMEGARLGKWDIVRILPTEIIVKDGTRIGVVSLE